MPKPTTWVLVADAARARLFQADLPKLALTPALERELTGTNLPSRDIASDRPGRTFDSGGQGRHAKEPSTDPARHAQEDFAQDLARLLEDEHKKGSFERLIVVAAPQFLGDFRKAMPKGLHESVSAEIAKDLTKLRVQDLEEHLREDLRSQRSHTS